MKLLLSSLGFIFAHTPEFMLRGLCAFVAFFIMRFMPHRAASAFSNLSHCFPNMKPDEARNIVRESCSRMVEMALFVVASPYISRENLKKRVKISDYVLEQLRSNATNPRPTILMIPHFAMMETITMFPILVDEKTPRVGVFYRPFDSQGMEDWVKKSRERFGIELLSRKKGLSVALKYLKENGVIAILYDQNAGAGGAVSFFFDRLCSTSELSGILIERTNADLAIFYARRTGFWRSEVYGERLSAKTAEEVTFVGNKWLETILKTDEIARFDWLWLHNRWKHFTNKNSILKLNISGTRSILDYSLKRMGFSQIPRITRIFIDAPSSISETVAFLPFVRLIRASRCDASVSLICDVEFADVIRQFGIADEIISAPSQNDYPLLKAFYENLSKRYPDIYLTLNDSRNADKFAKLIRAPYSYAMQFSRKRSGFTKLVKCPPDLATKPLSARYEYFLRSLEASGDVDFSPINLKSDCNGRCDPNYIRIGIYANASPIDVDFADIAKRISEKIPSAKFELFQAEGASVKQFDEIKRFFSDAKLQKSLVSAQALNALAECSVAVCYNADCAALANACGVPTVLISNTQMSDLPVFDAPLQVVSSTSAELVCKKLFETFLNK